MRNRPDELKIRKDLKEKLTAGIDYSREISDDEMKELIDGLLTGEGKRIPLSLSEKEKLRKELFFAVRKLDVLQELVDDTQITEIMINGPEHIFIEKRGACPGWNRSLKARKNWRMSFSRS